MTSYFPHDTVPGTPIDNAHLFNVSGISEASPGIIIQPKASITSISPSTMKKLTDSSLSPSKTDLSLSQLEGKHSTPPSTNVTKSIVGSSSSASSITSHSPSMHKGIVSPNIRSPLNDQKLNIIHSTTSSVIMDEESILSLSRNYKEQNTILQLRLQQATQEITRLQALIADRHIHAISFAEETREKANHDIDIAAKTNNDTVKKLNIAERKIFHHEQRLQLVTAERDAALEQIRNLRAQMLNAKVSALHNPPPHEMATVLLERWRNLAEISTFQERKNDNHDHISDSASVYSTVSTQRKPASVVHNSNGNNRGSLLHNNTIGGIQRPTLPAYISPPAQHRRGNDTATNNGAADIKPIQVARLIAKWNGKSPSSVTSSSTNVPTTTSSTGPSKLTSSPSVKSSFPSLAVNDPVSSGALLGRQGDDRALQAKINVLMNELQYTNTKQVPALVQHLTTVIENAQGLETKLIEERHAKEESIIALRQSEVLVETLEKQITQLRQRNEIVENHAVDAVERATIAEETKGIDRLQQEIAILKAEVARLRQNEETLQQELIQFQKNNLHSSVIKDHTKASVLSPVSPALSAHSPVHAASPPTHSLSPSSSQKITSLHNQELQELQNHISRDTNHIQDLNKQLDHAHAQNKELTQKLQDLTNTNTDLKEQLTKAHHKVDDAFTDLLRLENQINEKDDNIAELNETFKIERTTLRTQIDKLLEDRETSSVYLNEEFKLLQQQYNDLVTNSNQEELLLLKQINELKEGYKVLRNRYIECTKNIESRNIDLIYYTSLAKGYKATNQQQQRTITEQQSFIKELQHTVTIKTEKEDKLIKENQLIQETIKQLNKDIDQRNITIRQLQEALADSADRIPKLMSNITKLREKHEKDKNKITKLQVLMENEKKFRAELEPLLHNNNINKEINTIVKLINTYNNIEENYRSTSPLSTSGSSMTNN